VTTPGAGAFASYVEPEFRQMALITIDVQRDTLEGQPLAIAGTAAMIPRLSRLVEAFRRHSLPVIHVVRLYKPDGSNADPCRRAAIESGEHMLLADSPGSELVAAITPTRVSLDSRLLLGGQLQPIGPREHVMYKPRWGAFFNTPLESHLRGQGVTSIAIVGCNFPNCPRSSIYEASERDFRIVVVRDAISGIYAKGLRELASIGARPLRTRELIQCLEVAQFVPAIR
jgi:nicotinamidase-related amidase